jgi:hypothetical protein
MFGFPMHSLVIFHLVQRIADGKMVINDEVHLVLIEESKQVVHKAYQAIFAVHKPGDSFMAEPDSLVFLFIEKCSNPVCAGDQTRFHRFFFCSESHFRPVDLACEILI